MGVLSGSGVEIRPLPDSGKQLVTGFFALNAPLVDNQKSVADAVRQEVTAEMEKLFAIYNLILAEPVVEIFDDQDWATSWQQFFSTSEIIPGLVIRPSWEDYTPSPGQLVLTLDPGMAFGTGQHASTRLALSLLAACLTDGQTGQRLLDVGTGTGILAMAGALYGAGQVVAIDNDPQAVTVAEHNISNNRLQERIRVTDRPLEQISGSFDLVCANIIHDVLLELAPDIRRLLRPGGKLILAGILHGEQENSMAAQYAKRNIRVIRREHQDEWAALLLGG
jgi:ribosomal protein L11 methyltransferase